MEKYKKNREEEIYYELHRLLLELEQEAYSQGKEKGNIKKYEERQIKITKIKGELVKYVMDKIN